MRAQCAAFILALACVAWSAAAASAVPTASAVEPAAAAPAAPATSPALSPLRIFAAIEKAWNDDQPDSVSQFFPEDKIVLRLEKTAPEKAFYTNSQAAYMLQDEFRFTETESFEFLEFKYPKGGEDPPSARAQWSFRREPAGKTIVQKVRIHLRREADRWVVSEIRIQD